MLRSPAGRARDVCLSPPRGGSNSSSDSCHCFLFCNAKPTAAAQRRQGGIGPSPPSPRCSSPLVLRLGHVDPFSLRYVLSAEARAAAPQRRSQQAASCVAFLCSAHLRLRVRRYLLATTLTTYWGLRILPVEDFVFWSVFECFVKLGRQ